MTAFYQHKMSLWATNKKLGLRYWSKTRKADDEHLRSEFKLLLAF
jgi:hypothetical protein